MFKTPPLNKTTVLTDNSVKHTEEIESSAGRAQEGISQVRKSVGELESRLSAAPKTRTNTQPTKQKSQNKLSPAACSVENQADPEMTTYANRAQEAKAYLVKIKLLLNSSRNLKTELKDKIIEAVDKLYRLAKEEGEEKEITLVKESSIAEKKTEVEHKLIKKLEEHSKLLTEYKIETQRFSEEKTSKLKSLLEAQGDTTLKKQIGKI
ncbi:unnamed protein product [Parnassius apollo]|uniref:(apollo) hypothetical protein n=1 Tax=Parnassius apollo TaxID=110799 RepID=A0A8S3X963_PARAO|nr:unnamed protein product [Parnassius apollo]